MTEHKPMQETEVVWIRETWPDGEVTEMLVYRDGDYNTSGIEFNRPITLKQLVNFLDEEAEQRNNHNFVGAHRILGALLMDEVGQDIALQIMKRIAAFRGLDGMSGNYCGRKRENEDAFLNFGIRGPWREFEYPPECAIVGCRKAPTTLIVFNDSAKEWLYCDECALMQRGMSSDGEIVRYEPLEVVDDSR